jgi:hypothetical protein
MALLVMLAGRRQWMCSPSGGLWASSGLLRVLVRGRGNARAWLRGRNAGSFVELAHLGGAVGADGFGSEGVGGGGKAVGAVDCEGSGAGQAV